jgi:hypothetical protein
MLSANKQLYKQKREELGSLILICDNIVTSLTQNVVFLGVVVVVFLLLLSFLADI